MLRAMHSAYVLVAGFIVMGVAFSVMVAGLLFLPYPRVHRFVAPVFAWVLRVARVRLRVHFHPDFDPKVPSVFAQNHINVLDAHLAAAVIPRAFCGLMHAWQFKVPIYGWLMSMSRGIPVDPTKPRSQVVESISEAAKVRKEEGMSILVFPEGKRTPDGKLKAFKAGVFQMSHEAGLPVVPVVVSSSFFEVKNINNRWLFSPGKVVDVWVGPQMEVGSPPEFTHQLKAWFEDVLAQKGFPSSALDTARAVE